MLAQSKAQLDECRRTLVSIRQLHKQFRQKVTDDVQHCRESLTVSFGSTTPQRLKICPCKFLDHLLISFRSISA